MNFSEASPANGECEAGKPSNEVPKVNSNKASSLLCSGAWNLFEHMIAYLQAKGFFFKILHIHSVYFLATLF